MYRADESWRSLRGRQYCVRRHRPLYPGRPPPSTLVTDCRILVILSEPCFGNRDCCKSKRKNKQLLRCIGSYIEPRLCGLDVSLQTKSGQVPSRRVKARNSEHPGTALPRLAFGSLQDVRSIWALLFPVKAGAALADWDSDTTLSTAIPAASACSRRRISNGCPVPCWRPNPLGSSSSSSVVSESPAEDDQLTRSSGLLLMVHDVSSTCGDTKARVLKSAQLDTGGLMCECAQRRLEPLG